MRLPPQPVTFTQTPPTSRFPPCAPHSAPPSRPARGDLAPSDIGLTEVSLAFDLDLAERGRVVQQPVFAFLPLRSYGLHFIINAGRTEGQRCRDRGRSAGGLG